MHKRLVLRRSSNSAYTDPTRQRGPSLARRVSVRRTRRSNIHGVLAWYALPFVTLCLLTAAAQAQVHIEELRLGFGIAHVGREGNYKIGSWAPAHVLVRAEKDGFDGMLELNTVDSDDVPTAFYRPVHIAPNESLSVPWFVKAGKTLPEVNVSLIDREGRTRARRTFQSAADQIPDGASQHVTLLVGLGRPAGLDVDLISKRLGYPRDQFRIAQVESARDLPARWFGYDAVDHFILVADNPAELETMDIALQSALETWVRYGGHLVVSVGSAWPRVTGSFLGRMLPADIDRAETVRQLRELETYVGSSAAISTKAPVSVPHLTNLRGRILAGTNDLPLAVRGPYGFGTVTLVALELNREPFASWEGRPDFWLKLLAIRKQPQLDSAPQGAWNQRALTDLSSYLRSQLEQFEGISLVPFQWVAFFIFLYILLIGPVDYWFVKKVLKRMEFTWLTFPTIVVVVSLGAYLAAYWLKGDELRINKVEVVDVDQESSALRGTSWFTLFSPQIKNYAITVEPELAAAPRAPDQPGGPAVVVSWLGLAEDAMGGMARQGGVGLFRRGYAFRDDPAAQTLSLADVPVQVWSMKEFTARWHAQATPTVEAKLHAIGTDRVRGSVTNRLPVPLQDCVLAFGRKAYLLEELPVNGSALIEQKHNEDLKGYVTRRAASYAGAQANPRMQNQPTQFNPNDLIFTMMFHNRLPEGNQLAANEYFSDLDLSDHLDHQRAILVARVAGRGSKLFLNNVETTENINGATFLRVLVPVTAGPEEPEFKR